MLLTNVPSHDYTTFYLSIHQLMDIWVFSTLWPFWIMLSWTFTYRFLHRHIFSFLLGICLGVELVSHTVTLFDLLRNCQSVFQNGCIVYTPTSNVWGFQFLHILDKTCYHLFLTLAVVILVCMKWYFIVVLFVCFFSLWFWFLFPKWLMMLIIFSCAC